MTDDAESYDAVLRQLLAGLPGDYLNAIHCLTDAEVRRYDAVLDQAVIDALSEWVHSRTSLLDACGCYATAEILGFLVADLHQALRLRPTDFRT